MEERGVGRNFCVVIANVCVDSRWNIFLINTVTIYFMTLLKYSHDCRYFFRDFTIDIKYQSSKHLSLL